MRRVAFLTIFLAGLILMSGCATIDGFSRGLAEDSKALWSSLVKADKWFDEHTW